MLQYRIRPDVLADMNGMGRPNCFRTENGREFISRDYVE